MYVHRERQGIMDTYCEMYVCIIIIYVCISVCMCVYLYVCGCMCVCSRRMDVFKHNMYRGSVQAHVHAKVYNIVMVNIEI